MHALENTSKITPDPFKMKKDDYMKNAAKPQEWCIESFSYPYFYAVLNSFEQYSLVVTNCFAIEKISTRRF